MLIIMTILLHLKVVCGVIEAWFLKFRLADRICDTSETVPRTIEQNLVLNALK